MFVVVVGFVFVLVTRLLLLLLESLYVAVGGRLDGEDLAAPPPHPPAMFFSVGGGGGDATGGGGGGGGIGHALQQSSYLIPSRSPTMVVGLERCSAPPSECDLYHQRTHLCVFFWS